MHSQKRSQNFDISRRKLDGKKKKMNSDKEKKKMKEKALLSVRLICYSLIITHKFVPQIQPTLE